MAENYMARKDGLWTVVCLSPDVCKTPMGPSTPPIPYQVTASLGNAVQEVKTVKANGCPVVVLDQSFIPTTQGDEPGVAKGIKSGTVGDKCEPMEHSQNVRVGGKPILRHGDKFWMNDKNTTGIIVGQPPTPNIAVDEISSAVEPETPEEQGLWEIFKGWWSGKMDSISTAKSDTVTARKGASKAIMNLPVETLESFVQGLKYQQALEIQSNAALLTSMGHQEMADKQLETAAILMKQAEAFNLDNLKFKYEGEVEQAGGDAADLGMTAVDVGVLAKLNKPLGIRGGGKVKFKTDGNGKASTSKHGEPTVSDGKEGNFSDTCSVKGEPVDVATGDFLQNLQVIDLPGTLPLRLNRVYRSRASTSGVFGNKWADNWSQSLLLDDEEIHFTTDEGSVLSYFSSASDDKVEGINLHQSHLRLHGSRSGALFVFNTNTQQTLCFDAQPGFHRRLSSLCDRAGNHIDFIYQNDRLVSLIHSDGYRVELAWLNAQLLTVTRVDAQQRQWLVKCSYRDVGLLSECETFQFTHLYHEYDTRGFMTRWRDTDKTDVHCRYDAKGRITSTQAEGGYYCDRFTYDDVNRVTTYHDSEGGRTLCEYNAFGLVTRETDPLGRVTQTRWDRGNKVSQTDPLGRETRFRYNTLGQITHVQRPGGDITQYHYDEHGQVIRLTEPGGNEWVFTRNSQGKMLSQTDPQGRCQQFQYNAQGQLTGDIAPDGAERRYVWNEFHQLSKMMTPDEATTLFSQDNFGRLQSVTDPLGQVTRYIQSEEHAAHNGSLTAIHLPDGVIQRISYDGEKRQATVTDGEGKITRYTYGAFDILLALTRPDGEQLHFSYDSLTRLTQVTNACGETYRYERDLAGQLIRETDFTGRPTEYGYDAAGRRISARHADGRVVRWQWSVRDELLREDIWQEEAKQSSLLATRTYGYNSQGRLILAQSGDATVEFEYNADGDLLCERINGREVVHQRDEQTRQILSYSAGTENLIYGYDISGRLMQMQVGDYAPLQLEYDRLGRENQRHTAAGFMQSQGYSPTGMLEAQTAGRNSAINRRWAYDGAYNVKRIDDTRWGTSYYHVNSNDQIVHAEQKGIRPLLELFEYDAALNIIGHQQRRGGDGDVPPERINQTQQAGRVIRRGNGEYRYDSAGRLAEKRTEIPGYRPQVWRYRWDANSQLRGLITPDGEQWHYRYDAFGRRISKRRQEATRSKLAGYDYLWSGGQLIEETPVYADGTPAYEESIHWLYEPGALTPAARRENGQLHYVVSDHMGTPRELLTEKGDVAWASRLSTWGDATRYRLAANDDKLSCNLRFAGQYADEESGLHYNRHRYYDSETGQYLSPDPIGLAGGVNPYGYVHNPLGYIDPLGLCKTSGSGGHYSGTDKPWTKGATPDSIYTHIDPKTGRAVQNAIYDSNGNVIAHVDFKNHGIESGHYHEFPIPGNPGSGHGAGKPHNPHLTVPPGWDTLPPGIDPQTPIGQ
ncbi:PAAR-like domain-containing protein [Rahnella ecdela]|uniref:DUF4150 domain-containing protein n=1 Tax=Rahnella ecdela TaxID=2816250 RepID=A0ABS6LHY8_9GAMM|nr:PAAR-like domain-containing protein [Rahnella ecdela]MBU9846272.1 DUF4150 domain-containing protein [Rahnella ecdela]